MANIALVTAARIEVVESIIQASLPAAETIVAGAPVRIDSNGKFVNALATTAANSDLYGIGTRSVVAGEALTAVRSGILDGYALSGAYWSALYLSDTSGRVADAAGTVVKPIGYVLPAWAQTVGTAADKLFQVSIGGSQSGLALATADTLTVAGVIIPQFYEWNFQIKPFATVTEYDLAVALETFQVVGISIVPSTLQGGALTATIVKSTGTATPVKTTTPLHSADSINLNTGAYTVQNVTLTATAADLQFAVGDRLGIDYSGAYTAGHAALSIKAKRI